MGVLDYLTHHSLSNTFPSQFLDFAQVRAGDRHSTACKQLPAATDRQHELTPASSPNSLVFVVHHFDLQRRHCFQGIHKLRRITKRQWFGVFLQLIAPLHSCPGKDKTNFSLCHFTRTQTTRSSGGMN